MAVYCEFIDVIVPIEVIRAKYRGGWEKCHEDHREQIGQIVWYDDHLLRCGAMNSADVEILLSSWQGKRLKPFKYEAGEPVE